VAITVCSVSKTVKVYFAATNKDKREAVNLTVDGVIIIYGVI
jgi:hypothetical protein